MHPMRVMTARDLTRCKRWVPCCSEGFDNIVCTTWAQQHATSKVELDRCGMP